MAKAPTAPKPTERRSTEWAHSVLRERILSGEMEPGAAIAQASLADELGISRTPLREAMRLLQNEGLLEGEPNRRLRVAAVSVGELEQLYAMRIANESLALRVGIPLMDRSHVDAIRSAIEVMADALLAADGRRIDSAHREFHRLLVSQAGDRLAQLADTLWDHTARYRAAYVASTGNLVAAAFDAQADHSRILDSVEAGDGAAAAAALAEHYARTAEALIASADTTPPTGLLAAAVEQARCGR